MSKNVAMTCEECYFRRAGLCALLLESPCPTFRMHTKGSLSPPRQAPLVPRPMVALQATVAAA